METKKKRKARKKEKGKRFFFLVLVILDRMYRHAAHGIYIDETIYI
jgi:hypothetical protein